jgi:hypothetical protein
MIVEKWVKDGMVAVLVAPGYGSGWASNAASKNRSAMTFDPELAKAIENKEPFSTIKEIADRKFPHEYQYGLESVTVEWIPQGTTFYIHEYDGSEYIVTIDQIPLETA